MLATAALLLLAPAADAAPAVTARIGGVEYAATSTQGRFGGAADGQVRGAWQATVVHDPLRSGKTAPITDGSFTLRGLPEGGFTLVFRNGTAEIGRLSLAEVKANQEITLTVQVSDVGVVLLEEQRRVIDKKLAMGCAPPGLRAR